MLQRSHLPIFIVILFFGFLNVPGQTEAQIPGDDDNVWIEFMPEEDTQTAEIAPWEHGSVTFPLLIITKLNPWDEMKAYNVTLSAVTDKNWEYEINPPFVEVQPGEKEPASITVLIPHDTSSTEEGKLTVSGTARPVPGSDVFLIDAIEGEIDIEQYYSFRVQPMARNLSIDPGGSIKYILRVTNDGNGDDKFEFEIENLDKLEDNGIYVHFTPSELYIPEKTSKTFELEVSTSESAEPGKYNIDLRIYSPNQKRDQGTVFYEETDMNLEVRGSFATSGYIVPVVILILVIIIIVTVIIKKRRG